MCGDRTWAAEHIVGIAKDVAEDIKMDLRANFTGECTEVGMYLAMSRVAHREGYPEIGMYWEKAAFEEAEHAAKFAELLGEVVTDSTQKNLEMRVEAENGALYIIYFPQQKQPLFPKGNRGCLILHTIFFFTLTSV